jgi:coenzyme F420-reducing hydrogenase beta subunit
MIVDNDLQGVISSSMCIGCGACEMADPSVKVTLNPKKLIYEPESPGGPEAAAVCPAVRVDFEGLQDRLFPGQEVGPYGVVDAVYLAQSTELDRNVKASSGGLVKELLLALLADDEVDGVIALDHVAGVEFAGRIITDSSEIDNLPGSIYHNLRQTPTLQLLAETPGRFVVVGIPCQLEGLYTYVFRNAPHLRERIHTTIGLLCGWQYSHHSLRAMGEYLGYDPQQIEDVSYRGGGPVGKLTVKTSDGETYTASRRVSFGYQVAFDRHFNTPRCHLCINHSNFLADVVVGDAWLPSTVFTKTGISLIICRKPETKAIITDLEARGRIVTYEATTDEIRESQTDRVIFGEFAYAYADYLDEIGVHRPDMDGPNKGHGTLRPRREVTKFHRELVRKQRLMQAGRYQLLRVRKATLELRKFVSRYTRWFAVRILRVKSLTGQRQEIPRDRLQQFR